MSRTSPAPAATPAPPPPRAPPADGYTILVVSTGFIINPSLYSKVPYVDQRLHADQPGRGLAQRGVRASVVSGEVDQGADRTGEGQSRQIQLRPAGHRIDPASRRRTVQAALRSRPDNGAVHQRGPRHELNHRRPYADCVHGAAAGDDQHPGRQAARPGGDGVEAQRGPARGADYDRGRRSRPGIRHADRHRRACRDAEGADRPLAQARSCASSRCPTSRSGCSRLGFDPIANTPAEFGARIKSEAIKWDKVAKDANIRMN